MLGSRERGLAFQALQDILDNNPDNAEQRLEGFASQENLAVLRVALSRLGVQVTNEISRRVNAV